jgi:hypothetical protein
MKVQQGAAHGGPGRTARVTDGFGAVTPGASDMRPSYGCCLLRIWEKI